MYNEIGTVYGMCNLSKILMPILQWACEIVVVENLTLQIIFIINYFVKSCGLPCSFLLTLLRRFILNALQNSSLCYLSKWVEARVIFTQSWFYLLNRCFSLFHPILTFCTIFVVITKFFYWLQFHKNTLYDIMIW